MSRLVLIFTGLLIFTACSKIVEPTVSDKAFRDKLSDGTLGPYMMQIPAGKFMQGCLEEEIIKYNECNYYERPAHRVTIKSHAIGVFEITFEQWDKCFASGLCKNSLNNLNYRSSQKPVYSLTWFDAQDYVKWLSQETGYNYRLPTESEWEYAAKSNMKTLFPWGNDMTCKDARIDVCNEKQGQGPSIIGSYSANKYGLFDMIGNVSEWTQDYMSAHYYDYVPVDGSANTQPESYGKGKNEGNKYNPIYPRAIRGGSWLGYGLGYRVYDRLGVLEDSNNHSVGFRVVRDLKKN